MLLRGFPHWDLYAPLWTRYTSPDYMRSPNRIIFQPSNFLARSAARLEHARCDDHGEIWNITTIFLYDTYRYLRARNICKEAVRQGTKKRKQIMQFHDLSALTTYHQPAIRVFFSQTEVARYRRYQNSARNMWLQRFQLAGVSSIPSRQRAP